MLIEQGKRLLSVMEYAHSLMPMNFPDDESWINRYGIVSELGVDLLIPVATSAGRYRFMPGPEFREFILALRYRLPPDNV